MHYAPWTFCILTFGCKVNQYESQSVREAWQRMDGAETDAPRRGGRDSAQYVRRHRQCRDRRTAGRTPPPARSARRAVVIAGCAAEVARKQLPPCPACSALWSRITKSRLLDAPPLVLFAEGGGGSATPFPSSPRRSRRPRRHARPRSPLPYRRIPPGPSVLKVQDGCSLGCAYCIVP